MNAGIIETINTDVLLECVCNDEHYRAIYYCGDHLLTMENDDTGATEVAHDVPNWQTARKLFAAFINGA